MSTITTIALIGFGEVGQILADDLSSHMLAAYDLKFADEMSGPARACIARSTRMVKGSAEAAQGAQLVISAVTAAQTVEAARAAAAGVSDGTYYLDLNSSSPGMKRESARLIEAAGGRYIEGAVMSPVPLRRSASPILLGGPHGERFLPLARELGFSGASFYAAEIGKASAAKMCRSVMIKGIEALLSEALLAARCYGVEQEVLHSLADFFPHQDWPKLARYMISRALIHGTRRAEEMREAVRTVAEAGLSPLMSSACAQRQDWAARIESASTHEDLIAMLDAILAHPKFRVKSEASC